MEKVSHWLEWAEKEIGVKRKTHTARIIEYWAKFKMSGIKDEAVPWCSAFIGFCLESAGISTASKDKTRTKDSSQYWLHWTGGHKLDKPEHGCIAVMTRSGGGHVGFLIGEDGDNWVLLGGNQGSAVSIAKFPKNRFIGFIMPNGYISTTDIPNLSAKSESNLT